MKELHKIVYPQYFYNKESYVFGNYLFSKRKLQLLKSIIANVKNKGKKVIVSVVPFSHYYLELISKDEKLSLILNDFIKSTTFEALNPDILCNSITNIEYDCPELEMHDSAHPSKVCLKRFLAKCLDKVGRYE
jgi:hypothetical protein